MKGGHKRILLFGWWLVVWIVYIIFTVKIVLGAMLCVLNVILWPIVLVAAVLDLCVNMILWLAVAFFFDVVALVTARTPQLPKELRWFCRAVLQYLQQW
jgi:hypothetical protein